MAQRIIPACAGVSPSDQILIVYFPLRSRLRLAGRRTSEKRSPAISRSAKGYRADISGQGHPKNDLRKPGRTRKADIDMRSGWLLRPAISAHEGRPRNKPSGDVFSSNDSSHYRAKGHTAFSKARSENPTTSKATPNVINDSFHMANTPGSQMEDVGT